MDAISVSPSHCLPSILNNKIDYNFLMIYVDRSYSDYIDITNDVEKVEQV